MEYLQAVQLSVTIPAKKKMILVLTFDFFSKNYVVKDWTRLFIETQTLYECGCTPAENS